MKSLFIFGLGYVGQAVAKALREQGWRVDGSIRSHNKGLQDTVFYDGTQPIDKEVLESYDHFLITIPPKDEGCRAFLHHAHHLNPKWIGYCSSTGVYGDHQGEWVTESSKTLATFPTGLQRLKAEGQWSRFASRAPVVLFRLSGIYGPGKSVLDQIIQGSAQRIEKPGHVFSRIHVEDISQIIQAALGHNEPGAYVYNVADDCPASSSEVMEYACKLLEREVPPETPFAQAQLSTMRRQFYLDSKRVSNEKIRQELKITLHYPSYREGLNYLLKRLKDQEGKG